MSLDKRSPELASMRSKFSQGNAVGAMVHQVRERLHLGVVAFNPERDAMIDIHANALHARHKTALSGWRLALRMNRFVGETVMGARTTWIDELAG
ncbi:MAG: hypothetical protein IPO19_00330 [Rhodoferax sp.]|nr:hypothetical protein [Rhodoferax sp.]